MEELEYKVSEYLKGQFRDWDEAFDYNLRSEDDTIVVDFYKIFEPVNKEMRFHLTNGVLYFTDLSEGYQELVTERDNKFFWINLLYNY